MSNQPEALRLASALNDRSHDGLMFLQDAATELRRLHAEIEAMRERLRNIGDYAHDHSTGPAVPDAMWEVRSMAYDAI